MVINRRRLWVKSAQDDTLRPKNTVEGQGYVKVRILWSREILFLYSCLPASASSWLRGRVPSGGNQQTLFASSFFQWKTHNGHLVPYRFTSEMFSHELWDGRDMKEHGISLLLLSAETSGDIHNFSVAINKSSIILNAKFSPESSPAVSTPSSLKHALDWE